MPHWILKAAVQGIISHLPAGRHLNTFFQKHLTRRLRLTPAKFERCLTECNTFLEHYRLLRPDMAAPSVLELGTGWWPIVPIGCYLCGASEVWTIDIAALLSQHRVKEVMGCFLECEAAGRLRYTLPHVSEERLRNLKETAASAARGVPSAEALERLHIHVLVRDARASGLPSESVDYLISHWVLEHIACPVLAGILKEFRRLAAPGALMCHAIDMSDHYGHTDPSISPLNYLRFSPGTWRLLNNSFHYQNRLRLSDYRRMHEEAGFRILREETKHAPESALTGLRLAPEFEAYPRDDLLSTGAWLVSEPT